MNERSTGSHDIAGGLALRCSGAIRDLRVAGHDRVEPPLRWRAGLGRAVMAAVALFLGATSIVTRAQPLVLFVNTLEDVNAYCTTICSLRGAINSIANGGTITFEPSILPGTIVLQYGALQVLGKSFSIHGPGAGLLSIDGGQADRIFTVDNYDPLYHSVFGMSGLSLVNGRAPVVQGQAGASGSGDDGGAGSPAEGGCIELLAGASMSLESVTLRNCVALGGNGGAGGSGAASDGSAGGAGGRGGNGGNAQGGAISARLGASLRLVRTSIVEAQAIAGNGGRGGDGGPGAEHGSRGNGGAGGNAGKGFGGAIFLDAPSLFYATNITLGQGTARGGKGGNGGNGSATSLLNIGGHGGDGGDARGGLFLADTTVNMSLPPDSIYFGFATLGEGSVVAGLHGSGGSGLTPGIAGSDGDDGAAALHVVANPGVTTLDFSLVFGANGVTQCAGSIGSHYFDVTTDPSCPGFLDTYLSSFAVKPLDPLAPSPGYRPIWLSQAIDVGPCTITPTVVNPSGLVAVDLLGTPRPQGDACDIGAIETDYTFVGGFDW